MGLSLRRFVVIQLFLLWQGGFLFYAAVVVPAGTAVLGSASAQGAITARVTDALNLIGVVALAVIAGEIYLSRDPAGRRATARWCCWWFLFLAQGALLCFHQLLDSFMDPQRMRVVIHPPFYPVHRLYLWTSTLQWFICVILAWLTLMAWQAEDRDGRTLGQHETTSACNRDHG